MLGAAFAGLGHNGASVCGHGEGAASEILAKMALIPYIRASAASLVDETAAVGA